MYDGRNGLTRNVQAAVEYFRLGAAQNDASSHFGYGLALLKVDCFFFFDDLLLIFNI
jgi:TPR repeat protein